MVIEQKLRSRGVLSNEGVICSFFGEIEYFDVMINSKYLQTAQCFVAVYSVTNRTSFEQIPDFLNQALRVKDVDTKKLPIVVVGNKSDLESEREVSKEEGRKCADIYDAIFLETSAKKNENVERVFLRAFREILYKNEGEEYFRGEEWQKEDHSKTPEDFKRVVVCLVISLKRMENEKNFKFPKPLLFALLKLIFEHYKDRKI